MSTTFGSIKKRTREREDGSTFDVYRAAYPRPDAPPSASRKIERIFPTRKAATRWLNAESAKVTRGEWIDPAQGKRTFAAVAGAWQATWPLDGLAPKTRAGYRAILRRHVLPEFGASPITAITAEAIQRYLTELAADRAPNTIRRVHTVIRQVFAVAVERRYIGANPCDGVRLGRVRPAHSQPTNGNGAGTADHPLVTVAQVTALADAAPAHYRTFILTAAYTGARSGELRALRRSDWNPLHRNLTIARSLSEVTATEAQEAARDGHEVYGNLVFKSTKTYECRRVTLPAWLAAELDEHLPPDPRSLVFTTPTAEPIRQSNFLRRVWYPTVRKALPPPLHPLRFHDLRHSHASWLIAKGTPAGHVMKRLGHKDIRTTFNVYGHLYPDDEAALAGLFDAEPTPADPAVRTLHLME